MRARHDRYSEDLLFALLLTALAGWIVLIVSMELQPVTVLADGVASLQPVRPS